jgi:hypothetical protein
MASSSVKLPITRKMIRTTSAVTSRGKISLTKSTNIRVIIPRTMAISGVINSVIVG